jgi:hypothetical protein
MKHVVAILIVAIAIFAVGCQDNSSTEPIASPTHQMLKPTPTSGTVLLKGDISPMGTGGENVVFHVTGQVSYSYAVIGTPADPTLDFTFNTQAEFVPNTPIVPLGSVNGQSDYQISLASKEGVTYVQRDYYVQGFSAKFHVVFAIDENNSISVVSMTMDQFAISQNAPSTN